MFKVEWTLPTIIAGIVVSGLLLYSLAQTTVFWIVLALVIGVPIIWMIRQYLSTQHRVQSMPVTGPMQINITTSEIPPGSFNYRRLKVQMAIDVKISRQDWDAIKRMGLMNRKLFEYPAPSGDYNDTRIFQVSSLRQVCGIGFHDTIQMEEAKTELIQGLHSLKALIENRSAGPVTETIEI